MVNKRLQWFVPQECQGIFLANHYISIPQLFFRLRGVMTPSDSLLEVNMVLRCRRFLSNIPFAF